MKNTFYKELNERFYRLLKEADILQEKIEITTKALTAEEAIGVTKRKDFPIITGKDVMVQAECMGALGQAFTDAPAVFHGTLEEVCELGLETDSHNRGIFIATLNAVMKHLGLVDCTVHCRTEGPELCAVDVITYLKEHYQNPKIALVGYQPAMLEALAKNFQVRVADLSPVNVGHERYGVMVEDGSVAEPEMCWEWADLVLVTGSTICNGSIVEFLGHNDKVLFFGTTLAGAAKLMNLPRLCFADRYQ